MHHKRQGLFYEKDDKNKKENTQGKGVVVKESYIEKMALKESKGSVFGGTQVLWGLLYLKKMTINGA